MKKDIDNWAVVGLAIGVILGAGLIGCSAQSPITVTPTRVVEADPWVDINSVEVIEGEGIEFWGQTNLSEEDCFYTQLFADASPVDWWPVGKCFPVSNQDWYFCVPFGVDGAPENLSDDVQYQIRIWWPGVPETVFDQLYFDLTAPPAN